MGTPCSYTHKLSQLLLTFVLICTSQCTGHCIAHPRWVQMQALLGSGPALAALAPRSTPGSNAFQVYDHRARSETGAKMKLTSSQHIVKRCMRYI